MSDLRPSTTDPLFVSWFPVGPLSRFGLTLAPGEHISGVGSRGETTWRRDLDADLDRLVALKVDVVASLLPTPELARLRIPDLRERLLVRGLRHYRHPIVDGHAPRDVVAFGQLVLELTRELAEGRRVVGHCRAGLGRAGTLGAAVVLQAGVRRDAEDAIAFVREVRSPRAVESDAQASFLAAYARILRGSGGTQAALDAIRDRRRAALLGLAVGDALGVPAEFMAAEAIARALGRIDSLGGGGPFGFAPGETTDDTALAVATAAAYTLEEPDFDTHEAAVRMQAWFATDPKDVGGQTRRALLAMRRGVPVWRAGREASASGASAGNGSLMRCLATGLLRLPEDPLLEHESVAASEMTHDDPRCVASCVAYNAVLSTLVHGVGDVDDGLEQAATLAARYDAHVTEVVEGVRRRRPPRISGSSIGYVLYCLERALIAARDGEDLRETLITIVHEGGDTDTNAAVAGALLGAKLGLAALPETWLGQLLEPPGLADVPWLRALWRGEPVTAD